MKHNMSMIDTFYANYLISITLYIKPMCLPDVYGTSSTLEVQLSA